jgi:long-chain fatty acid transport protein
MKTIVKGLALSAITSSVLMAGAYKIPEQSLNSMALGAAYVAHTTGADTAYFNPANMAFMGDKQYVEGAVTLAHLPSNTYTLMGPYSGQSEKENILIPNFHYVAAPMDAFRWGVSLTAPGGLTKRWETPFQKASAEEFTLKAIELGGVVSYKVMDNLSVGGGVRLIYSEGIVKSDSADAHAIDPRVPSGARDMEGDTVEFGYNLAVTYKPTDDINLAATYRSNVDLNEEGTAKLYGSGQMFYDGDATVSVPLPAALNLAISKTWNNTFTLEAVYERTYWSSYENLDFGYSGTNAGMIPGAFRHSDKNWKDTNTYRLGATVELDKITMMMGFAIDETPVPVEYVSFELPDSDAKIFSMGFRYQQTESISCGAAFLYDSKDPLSLKAGEHADKTSLLNSGGSFSGGGAYLTTLGMAYEF